MNAKQTASVAVLLAALASAAATQPGLFSAGSATGSDGWKLSYSAVARPPLSSGERIRIQTDATYSKATGQATVFHRFFTDPVHRTYFGYDVAVRPAGAAGSAQIEFQPLSLRADQLPKEYGAAEFRVAALPGFPAQTYQTGQTIAVDVLANPASGQKVVDYIQVTQEPEGKPASAGMVAKGAPAADEKAKASGNPAAPVRIDICTDFACPACRVFFEEVLPLIVKDYVITGKVYLVVREYPLRSHPYAREAANLATAAARVGKYRQVAEALYRTQASWAATGKVWDVVASVLTPDELRQVEAAAKEPAVAARVQEDMDWATNEKVKGTPSLVINRGQKVFTYPGPGPANYAILQALIEDFLK